MLNVKTGQGNHSFGKSSSFSKQDNLNINKKKKNTTNLESSVINDIQ